MTIYSDILHWSDISLNHDLVTKLDLITDFDVITKFQVSMDHLQRLRLANGWRLLIQIPGPLPFGTCICSNVETIHSWPYLVSGLWVSFRLSLCPSILLMDTVLQGSRDLLVSYSFGTTSENTWNCHWRSSSVGRVSCLAILNVQNVANQILTIRNF